jgi:hypothetical protein
MSPGGLAKQWTRECGAYVILRPPGLLTYSIIEPVCVSHRWLPPPKMPHPPVNTTYPITSVTRTAAGWAPGTK